jgi:hypothetical protein
MKQREEIVAALEAIREDLHDYIYDRFARSGSAEAALAASFHSTEWPRRVHVHVHVPAVDPPTSKGEPGRRPMPSPQVRRTYVHTYATTEQGPESAEAYRRS